MEEKLCLSCKYYQLKHTGDNKYWKCTKNQIQIINNKCSYYQKRKKPKSIKLTR